MGKIEVICIHANGIVDKGLVRLSKGSGDQVLWVSAEGGPYTVHFPKAPKPPYNGSPFGYQKLKFKIPAGGGTLSGKVTGGKPKTRYQYKIDQGDDGGIDIDP